MVSAEPKVRRSLYPSLEKTRKVRPAINPIPLDWPGYSERIGRIQRIVNAVDAELRWPRRLVIPTNPGEAASIVEVAA